jgi:hypothetical protein
MNDDTADAKRRAAAKARLIEHLQSQKPIDIGRWTREELYERTQEEQRAAQNLPMPKNGKIQ